VRNQGPLPLLRPVKAIAAAATGSREERQRRELIEALTEAGGNQSRAAELLGISRVTVWNRMKRYGVRAERQVRE
ncbi:MAG: helix-turn-helix domain-containing protein, partial [Desulfobulbus sp.]|nr:helix-turn-helix domain-containing protein [Desulfobulbus sp.]